MIETIGNSLQEKKSEVELSPINNLVKYEFKMLKTFDDMDIFDYKFNYFTKNVNYILLKIMFSCGKVCMILLKGTLSSLPHLLWTMLD